MHAENSFITLTYDDEHLPVRASLDYPVFQRFMKRLRKSCGIPVRFFMCGEYGDLGRPHYHALLFGLDFPDRKYFKRSPSGERLFRSEILERLWPFGHSLVGDVTFESAAYCARYCCSKVTGDAAAAHYSRSDASGVYSLVPEFAHMSLKPGLGASWLAKFGTDVFPHDRVVIRGVECRVPKYYDVIFGRSDPDRLEEIKADRVATARLNYLDNTDERLAVREAVQVARSSLLKRGLV